MVIQSQVRLTPDQTAALALIKQGKRHTCLYGGSRSGKTFLIVLVIVLRALMFPGSRHLIYRLRLKDAIQSIWLETLPKVLSFFPGIGRILRANETRHVMEFANGSGDLGGWRG
jgi:phage terminase large subunit